MSFILLSQMERTRHEKEDNIRNTGFNASLILTGVFVILACFLSLAFIWLAAAGETQSATSQAEETSFVPVCESLTGIFGLLGILFIIASTLRRRIINTDLEAAESEFQLLQSQVIDRLENNNL